MVITHDHQANLTRPAVRLDFRHRIPSLVGKDRFSRTTSSTGPCPLSFVSKRVGLPIGSPLILLFCQD